MEEILENGIGGPVPAYSQPSTCGILMDMRLKISKALEKGQRLEPRRRDIRHSSCSFNQLRQFVDYRSAIAGVPVVYIDPAYCTSKECPICHYVSRANRPDRDNFQCAYCGYYGPADTIAA